MKIKLDIDEIRKNINSDKSFDELIKEWGDVVSEQYKEKFAIALKNRDIIEAVSLISRAMYKTPHYTYRPFRLALVVELHRDFEEAVNNTKIDRHLNDILSRLYYQELTLGTDKGLLSIIKKETWPICDVKIDKLILPKPFMRFAQNMLDVSKEELIDRCFVRSDIKEIVEE